MKIEVGKFYKTRDGRKARIYAVDCGGKYPVHGGVLDRDSWIIQSWREDGVYSNYFVNDGRDLISEWVELKSGSFWVNVYDSGTSDSHKTKELAYSCAIDDRLACVEVKWTEGEGL